MGLKHGLLALMLVAAISLDSAQADAEREVRAFAETVRAAVESRDRAVLERAYAPSFTAVMPTGVILDRAGTIAVIMQGGMSAQKFTDQETFTDRIVMHGPAAATRTVISRYSDPGLNRDQCLATLWVYARMDGEWRLIGTEGSTLHNGPLVPRRHDGLPGTYDRDAGGELVIVETGKTLFARLPAAPDPVPLFDLPDNEFVAGGDFRYRFTRDAGGRATSVTMSRFGRVVWTAKRRD